MLIDTHCHLSFKVYKNQVDGVVERARAAGVGQMVSIGTHLANSRQTVELASRFDGVWAAVGVHPHHVYDYMKKGVGIEQMVETIQIGLSELVKHPQVVAIGEIGFDKHEYLQTVYGSMELGEQYLAYQRTGLLVQLELARESGKAVILHNREAIDELLRLFDDRPDLIQPGKMVLHCCEPDERMLELAVKHGLYIGVDGDVTYTPEKQEFIKTVPLDRLVLETDSPYLLPEPERTEKQGMPFKDRVCEPKHVVRVGEMVAKLQNKSLDQVAEMTTNNAERLFGLPEKVAVSVGNSELNLR